MLLSALLLPALALLAPSSAPPARDAAPRAQVRFATQLTRVDSGENGANPAPPAVLGTPVLTTLDRSTGSISVTGSGGQLSYAISLSPTVEGDTNAALLWNIQLSGSALPGATSVTLNGASRVAIGKEEPVAEVTLRDPKTGRQSSFRLRITTTVTKP